MPQILSSSSFVFYCWARQLLMRNLLLFYYFWLLLFVIICVVLLGGIILCVVVQSGALPLVQRYSERYHTNGQMLPNLISCREPLQQCQVMVLWYSCLGYQQDSLTQGALPLTRGLQPMIIYPNPAYGMHQLILCQDNCNLDIWHHLSGINSKQELSLKCSALKVFIPCLQWNSPSHK